MNRHVPVWRGLLLRNDWLIVLKRLLLLLLLSLPLSLALPWFLLRRRVLWRWVLRRWVMERHWCSCIHVGNWCRIGSVPPLGLLLMSRPPRLPCHHRWQWWPLLGMVWHACMVRCMVAGLVVVVRWLVLARLLVLVLVATLEAM